jgi:simple sugar transport system ATP-binding protein
MNVIELRGIHKYFGDFCANKNIDFDLKAGEVHALLGENGAGKSTLMNILYGLYSHDAGSISINGKEIIVKGPGDAIANGIGMVQQHFALIPQLSVTQNIFLGMKETGFVLNMEELEKRVADLNEAYGFNVEPGSLIWQLPVGVQQKVEILKLLMRDAKILILDEPTAVLTPQEVEDLFTSIRMLTDKGCSVILITHKIEDVITHCDRVTVLRSGCVTGTVKTADVNKDELAKMMVGHDVFLTRNSKPHDFGKVEINAKNLCAKNNKGLPALKDVSFSIRAGEILGIAGVDGNGQLELGEALTGLRKFKGSVDFGDGQEMNRILPRDIIDKGVGHIPDDRHKKGLVLPFSVKENMIIASQRSEKFSHGPWLKQAAIKENALEMIEQFDVRPREIEKLAGDLSGGNQQKVILAREFSRSPRVLIALQPTRGLDVGAIEFVWSKIVEARDAGAAVLLLSTDLDEIRSLSDTIAVMFEGELSAGMEFNVPLEQLGLMMAGESIETAEETA